MNQCLDCSGDISENITQQEICRVDVEVKCETILQLEARIFHLESELKKQKIVAEKGIKFTKVLYGDKFENDSLF